MAKIKYIFFDLGDTLVDMEKVSSSAMDFVLKPFISKYNKPQGKIMEWKKECSILFEQYKSNMSFYTIKELHVQAFKTVLLDTEGFNLENGVISSIVEQFWKYIIRNCELFPDVRPTISSLINAGYCLGLITDGDIEVVIEVLKRHNLFDTYPIRIISSMIKIYKPSIKLYQEALNKANCLANEAIYVGDTEIDIKGAKEIGMSTILLKRNNIPPIENSKKTRTQLYFQINSLLELPIIIKKINQS